jgi:hypothetical protein
LNRTFLLSKISIVILGVIISLDLFANDVMAKKITIAVSQENVHQFTTPYLLNIVQGSQLTWNNGSNVILVIDDLKAVKNDDFNAIFKSDKNKFWDMWRIKFFSGRATLPRQFKSVKDALEFVKSNPNAIYVPTVSLNEKLSEGLKFIKLDI